MDSNELSGAAKQAAFSVSNSARNLRRETEVRFSYWNRG